MKAVLYAIAAALDEVGQRLLDRTPLTREHHDPVLAEQMNGPRDKVSRWRLLSLPDGYSRVGRVTVLREDS